MNELAYDCACFLFCERDPDTCNKDCPHYRKINEQVGLF